MKDDHNDPEETEDDEITLGKLGELQILPSECAILLEYSDRETENLIHQCSLRCGEKYREWNRGRLKGIAMNRLVVQKMARAGSTPAQAIFNTHIDALSADLEGRKI